MIEEKDIRKKKITDGDWKKIADQIYQQYTDRKTRRADLEGIWKEIDRQLKQKPDKSHKTRADGSVDPAKAWFPEMELPYQSQTLEITTADVRRMMFPDQGPWFTCFAELNDGYLKRAEAENIVGGMPAKIDQDSANQIVSSWMMFLHQQYDFKAHYDLINADVIKYGASAPRERIVKKKIFMMTESGVKSSLQEIPVLVPRSIKDVYLDDTKSHLQNEGIEISPAIIQCKDMNYDDILLAAKKGSDDPNDEQGGWMPSKIDKIKKGNGKVKVLEWEGDLLVSKSRDSLFVPNVVITVCLGEDKQPVVIRARFNKFETCSYIPHFYCQENIDDAYATSPLIKGMPLQKMATMAANGLLMSAAYDSQPALQYDGDDPTYAKQGGPVLYPGASIPTTGDIKTIPVGTPAAMLQMYGSMITQYESLTGTQSPRMGAQTPSHTTAFSKQQEIVRGTVRTVDYVQSVNSGPMYKHLQLTYKMSKGLMGNKDFACYNYQTKAFIETLRKEHLPENVHFEVYGASTPGEDAAQSGAEINAIQATLNIELIKRQLGEGKPMNLDQLQRRFLEKAKVSDIDELFTATSESVPSGTQQQTGMDPASGVDTGGAGLLLQNIAIGNR